MTPNTYLRNVNPTRKAASNVALWFGTYSISGVPETSMGWLVAQGWVVTAVSEVTTTNPPTYLYTLTHRLMEPWMVLQQMVNDFTTAYNDGREMNDMRYDDIVVMYLDMISKSQSHYDTMGTTQNTYAAVYLGKLDEYMTAVDTLISEARDGAEAAAENVDYQLNLITYDATQFYNDYSSHAAQIETLITEADSLATSFIDEYDGQITQLEADFASHLSDIGTWETEAETDLEDHATDLDAKLVAMTEALATHETAFDLVVTNAQASANTHKTDMTSELSAALTKATALFNAIDSLLTTADTTLTTHIGDYNTVLALLAADYATHETTAEELLVDLGTTELARINEKWDADLATNLQALMDNGFYASQMGTDITARNTRDRNEEIAALNDRLSREKLENEHRLYEQQQQMRDRTMAGKDRVHSLRTEVMRYKVEALSRSYEQLIGMRKTIIDTKQRLMETQQHIYEWRASAEEAVYAKADAVRVRGVELAGRIQDARSALTQWKANNDYRLEEELTAIRARAIEATVKQFAATSEKDQQEAEHRNRLLEQVRASRQFSADCRKAFADGTARNAEFLASERHRLAVLQLEADTKRLLAEADTHTQEMDVLKYQVSERNNLIVALAGFMERRTDEYPNLEDLSKLAGFLGDTGITVDTTA